MLPLAYGGGRDLDVRKFQLLPVRPIALAGGLASTFILSPGVWLTAAVAVVLAAGFPDAAGNLPLLALSGLVLVLMCVVAGQVVSTGADLLGRQRHARDLMVLLTLLLTAVPVVMFFLLRSQYADPTGGAGLAAFFAWVPPAWPGVAMAAAGQGQAGTALAALGGSLVVIGLGVWLWTAIISRAMLAQDSSTIRASGTGDPFARFARWLPGNRRGAVAALELRLLWREPARLPGVIISTVVFGGVFTIIAAALFDLGTAGMAVFGVCAVSFIAVGHRLNEIGIHSSALWMNVVARGRASNDLIGRDLASALIDVPVLLIALAAIAIDRGEWSYVLPALCFRGGEPGGRLCGTAGLQYQDGPRGAPLEGHRRRAEQAEPAAEPDRNGGLDSCCRAGFRGCRTAGGAGRRVVVPRGAGSSPLRRGHLVRQPAMDGAVAGSASGRIAGSYRECLIP